MQKTEVLNYYKTHGRMSKPSNSGYIMDIDSNNPNEIKVIVQNNMLHIHWLWAYKELIIPEKRKDEVNLRTMEEKLLKLKELMSSNQSRLIGNCRDFSLFCCSILRDKEIPARVRCGFSTYLTPGKNEDHWITEYYSYNDKRWILMDSQIDEMQKERLKITINPEDLPKGAFSFGGEAWLLCRNNERDPQTFGILEWWGMDYVLSNFLLDIASLMKNPMLPWDMWDGLKSYRYDQLDNNQLTILDRLAMLSLEPDNNFNEISEIYNRHLKVPDDLSRVRSCFDSN